MIKNVRAEEMFPPGCINHLESELSLFDIRQFKSIAFLFIFSFEQEGKNQCQ